MSGISQGVHFEPVVGVIKVEEALRLKKLIYRATRGMAYMISYETEETLYTIDGHELK